MGETRIGRVLVASLHQAIADVLPARLEFYENWLNSAGLRQGTIGLAPLSAVLGFLRAEGDGYAAITSRAGAYAADWSYASLPGSRRLLVRVLPARLRARAALRFVRRLVRATYPGSRALVRVRRRKTVVDIRGSLFCDVRAAGGAPRCGFYAAAVGRYLELVGVRGAVEVSRCRAAGGAGCELQVVVHGARTGRRQAAA